jgi:hypothetical protein
VAGQVLANLLPFQQQRTLGHHHREKFVNDQPTSFAKSLISTSGEGGCCRGKVSVTIIQMPALHTRHFGWLNTGLRYPAHPMLPIFRPEGSARALYCVAGPSRPKVYPGWPTVEAVVGNKLAPGMLRRYLGKTGFASSKIPEPGDPHSGVNLLCQRLKGNHRAQAAFDRQANEKGLERQASLGRLWIGTGLAMAAVCLLASRRE